MINGSADFIASLDAFTMFYTGGGNVLIEISEFTSSPGAVLLEQTSNGGSTWVPWNCQKLGRGMNTNAVGTGPAKFRGEADPGLRTGIRVRCQNTLEMEPILVRITFAGGIYAHAIRAEPKYIIEEVPDLRDLLTEERS